MRIYLPNLQFHFFVTILTLEVISMNSSFFLQISLLGIKMRNNNEIIEKIKESTAYQGQILWRRSKTLLTKSQSHIPSQYFLLFNLQLCLLAKHSFLYKRKMLYGLMYDMITCVRHLMMFLWLSNNVDLHMDHLRESHLISLENHCNVIYGIKVISLWQCK